MKTVVQSSISIDRAPESIARIMLDPEKAPLWNNGLERFEVVSEAPGLVGSKARLHYAQGGRRYVMEDELLEVTANRRFLSRVSGEAIEAEIETVLTPTDGGTRVVIRWTGSGRPVMLRLLLPLMRRSMTRQIETDLESLKRLAEAG